MAYTTDAALLQSIRDAIDALVTGRVKAYRIGDREFRYNELGELQKLEESYMNRVAVAETAGATALASFERPN